MRPTRCCRMPSPAGSAARASEPARAATSPGASSSFSESPRRRPGARRDTDDRLTRIPLLSDSRGGGPGGGGARAARWPPPRLLWARGVVAAGPGPGGVVLRPPWPRDHIQDVGAAVREALAYPLAGPQLEEVARRGGTATVV